MLKPIFITSLKVLKGKKGQKFKIESAALNRLCELRVPWHLVVLEKYSVPVDGTS
jgi:hypothetical protein